MRFYYYIKRKFNKLICKFIKSNLYWVTSQHGYTIHYGFPSIENQILEIDFDKQGINFK